jgi:hypothetical protein
MRRLTLPLAVLALATGGCGDDGEAPEPSIVREPRNIVEGIQQACGYDAPWLDNALALDLDGNAGADGHDVVLIRCNGALREVPIPKEPR